MALKNILPITILLIMTSISCTPKSGENSGKSISATTMEEVYQEIKTPYKYGIVLKHPDSSKMVDSPTVFRHQDQWYMTYIVFDGQGYETWLAQSDDLLTWESRGKILSFTDSTWDANQKAGYMSLVDIEWEGSYEVEKYDNTYHMSYLGGSSEGYEAGILGIGMADTGDISDFSGWERAQNPVLLPTDRDARWYDNKTIYKSLIIRDKENHAGHPFVMYYNAKGDTANYESIAMAVSDDMVSWKRYGSTPVITEHAGICGDAQIAKIGDVYVMFYFGAFWKPGAFERFACSYDLIHWTKWEGDDLLAPSEDYDSTYAHKPWVIKWKGIVYHFYTAVGSEGRVIAVATSERLR
ncbi:MAG: glycosylase [Cyclobacteriaceae bacterium]|nr:glycosylase [Cyclobacteriaceae bacterium]